MSIDGYKLLHDGALALAKVEANGIRIDEEYLAGTITSLEDRIKGLETALRETKEAKEWKKTYGAKTNYQSRPQLAVILSRFGAELPQTEKGGDKTDEAALEAIDSQFVRDYLEIAKLKKACRTYLHGIRREVVDGFLHPFFNLHTVTTYRSSSDSPNFQNIPVRDPEIGELIRRCIIPRKGRELIDGDFKGMEVGVAACYHHDPAMIKYIKDKRLDLHRDMASELFMLPMEQVDKDIRFTAKSYFVFAEFYGDYYIDVSRSLWKAAGKLELADASTVQEHLRRKGIRELGDLDPKEKPRSGTFEKHVQDVENRFWYKRFPVYAQWKKDWFASYLKQGFFKTKTGFYCRGSMRRNQAINFPVQGSAFHVLLKIMNWIVLGELRKRKMKTLIVGQIHDSLVADVPKAEKQQYAELLHEMIEKLTRLWKWIIVPLEIEMSASDKSWADMNPFGGNG